MWESRNGDTRYMISVCQPLNTISSTSPCGDHQSSVCQVNADGQSVNIGTFSTSPNVTEIASEGVVELRLQGEACAEQAGKFYTTIINFKCGKTLVRFGIIWSMFYMMVIFWYYLVHVLYDGNIWYYMVHVLYDGKIWYYLVHVLYDGKIWYYLVHVLYYGKIWYYLVHVLYDGKIWYYLVHVLYDGKIWYYLVHVCNDCL